MFCQTWTEGSQRSSVSLNKVTLLRAQACVSPRAGRKMQQFECLRRGHPWAEQPLGTPLPCYRRLACERAEGTYPTVCSGAHGLRAPRGYWSSGPEAPWAAQYRVAQKIARPLHCPVGLLSPNTPEFNVQQSPLPGFLTASAFLYWPVCWVRPELTWLFGCDPDTSKEPT